jgi:hypothetical protein
VGALVVVVGAVAGALVGSPVVPWWVLLVGVVGALMVLLVWGC